MIPKIIHQIWLGPHPRPIGALDTWRRMHPHWEYHLWHEENLPTDFIRQDLIDGASDLPNRADFLRYELLLRFGGVYIDADMICLRNMDPLLEVDGVPCEAYTTWSKEEVTPYLVNSVIGSLKGHRLMRQLVQNATAGKPAWKVSGPKYFTEQVLGSPELTVYPSSYFNPAHHRQDRSVLNKLGVDILYEGIDDTRHAELMKQFPDTYGLHLYGTGLWWYRRWWQFWKRWATRRHRARQATRGTDAVD